MSEELDFLLQDSQPIRPERGATDAEIAKTPSCVDKVEKKQDDQKQTGSSRKRKIPDDGPMKSDVELVIPTSEAMTHRLSFVCHKLH